MLFSSLSFFRENKSIQEKIASHVRNQRIHLANSFYNNTFVNDANYSSKQICIYNKYSSIRNFIEKQWYEARKSLNLNRSVEFYSNPIFPNRTLEFDHNTYIDRMYHFHPGRKIIVFHINNTLIGYVYLYKCGTQYILQNLNQYMMNEKNMIELNSRQDYERFINNIKTSSIDNFSGFQKPINLSTSTLRTQHSRFKIFAYIRDPMLKMESGFSQAVIECYDLLNKTKISITTVRQWLIDILNYKNVNVSPTVHRSQELPLRWLDHIYPMSSSFFEFNVDILLSQEKLVENWEKHVVPTYGFQSNKLNHNLGSHKSSIFHVRKKITREMQYIYKFRLLFRQIETEDINLWLAMCRLILIDYICFPQFQLPFSCRSLQKEVDEGRNILLAPL